MKNHQGTVMIRVLFSVTIALASVFLFSRVVKADGKVEINTTNFPDENFRSYVSDNFDTDDNGYLDSVEVQNTKEIIVECKNITDLNGIEYFTSLISLNCSGNYLTALDLSKNTALKKLSCGNNQLTTLDVSDNTRLEYLYCVFNPFTKLDVSKNTALLELNCYYNQLTTLDVSKNTALTVLSCYNNKLTTLDVSKNTALIELNCYYNQLTALDVSNNTALTKLNCSNNQLTTLDVSKNTALRILNCSYNQLTTLDVSKNTALAVLFCGGNYLSVLPKVGDSITEFRYEPQYKTASIISQPKDFTGKAGDTATFKIDAEGKDLTYQWKTYKSGKWVNSSLPGSKTDTLSVGITASRDGYKFRCVIKDAIGNKVTSKTVTLHLGTPIAITTQPKDYTGAVGSTATFKVKATGTGLKYQWQTYSSGKWKNSSLTGATTATLSVPVTDARDGYKFRCVVTDPNGQKVTSNAATLHVATPVAITSQPKDYTGAVGSTATFKVKATGTGLKYQWQSYKNGKWVNSSLPGYNTATLSVGVTASRDGYKFRCVVTDKYNQTATSKSAVLHVATPVAITSQPKDFTGPVGSTAEFKVKATGTGLKYQWQTYKSGTWKNSSFTGASTATLSVDVTASRDGYKFRCVISDSLGNTVTSKTATLHVDNSLMNPTSSSGISNPSNLGLIDADEGQAIPEPEETEKIIFDTEDTIESVTSDVTEDGEAAVAEPEPVENTEALDAAEDDFTGLTGNADEIDDALTYFDNEADTVDSVSAS